MLFKQKTAYEMRISDWSSDVCSFRSAQLFDGGLSVDVARHNHDFLFLFLQPQRQLAGTGGLASALQAGNQDHRWRLRAQVQRLGDTAERGGQLLLADAQEFLAGAQPLRDQSGRATV